MQVKQMLYELFFRQLGEKMRKAIVLFPICSLPVSCAYKQISFDAKKWKNEKNRYCMADSLIIKINEKSPKELKYSICRETKLEERIKDTEVSY